jgi:ABC-2 type transport system permease protein
MRGAVAIFRREFAGTLDSPVAWVAFAIFVLCLHTAFYFLGYPIGQHQQPALWAGRVATLDALFAWLPLFFSIMAPALTMGSWAEERRSGTDELLLTQPISLGSIVLGKFLSAWALLTVITAIAVFAAAGLVASIGPLDWGTVFGGVVGAILLAGVSIAIGLVASALTQEQLVAFLSGALVLSSLWSAGLFVRVVPGPLAEVLWYASPSLHFLESGARGLFDARDLVYYGLFMACALLLNKVVMEGRRWD